MNKRENTNNSEVRWLSMSEAASHTPYSAEYLSLLARKGKLVSKKINGVWYTSKSALEDYMKKQMLRAQVLKGQMPFAPMSNEAMANVQKGPENPLVIDHSDLNISSLEVSYDPASLKRLKSFHSDIRAYMQENGLPMPKEEEEIVDARKEEKLFHDVKDSSYASRMIAPEFFPLAGKENVVADTLGAVRKETHEGIEKTLEKVLDKKLGNGVFTGSVLPRIPALPRKSWKVVSGSKMLLAATLFLIVGLTTLPVPFVFSTFERTLDGAKGFFTDANTVMGFRPGTHKNELLLLDKEGNIAITGHIETSAQLKSSVANGTAPIVVDSKTLVANLNAEYLGGASSTDFTLAFVTKNGAVTTEDVQLLGSVEVGETLLVRGATKLLSALSVDGNLSVFGNAEFSQALSVLGPATFKQLLTAEGNLSVGKNASVRGALVVGGALSAASASFSSLGVSGDLTAHGDVKLGSSDKTLTITSDNITLDEDGNEIITGTLTAAGLLISGDLSVDHLNTTGTATSTFATPVVFNNTVSFISAGFSSLNVTGSTTLADLLVSGSTTLQNLTFSDATGTNATTTNFFSSAFRALVGRISSLIADDISVGALTATNSTTTNATTTNLYADTASTTNLSTINGSIGFGQFGNTTTTNATSTNIFSETSSSTNLYSTNAAIGNAILGNATATSATTTNFFSDNASTTNLFFTTARGGDITLSGLVTAQNFMALGSSTLQNLTFVNATGTNATTTNFFATTASSTNIFATNAAFGALTAGPITSGLINGQTISNAANFTGSLAVGSTLTATGGLTTLSNLLLMGSSTLQNFSFTSATGTNATTTNFFATTASTTNLFGTTGRLSTLTLNNLTMLGSTTLQNFTFTNATGTSATTTNFFSTNFTVTNLESTNLSSQNSTSTNATSTNFFFGSATGGSLTTTGLATLANLLTLGSTTLQNFTFTSATGTNATTTNFFATTASTTNLFFTSARGGTAVLSGMLTASNILATGSTTLQNFTFVNATGTAATTTNFFATTASSTNLFFTTGRGGNFTSTGLGTFANLLLTGSTTLQNLTFVNATGTSATTTNFFATNLSSTNLSIGSATTTGNIYIGGSLTVAGSFASSITNGQFQFLANPTGTSINQGTAYINPSSAGTNNVLLGIAVNGTEKFRVDAEGDTQIVGTFNSTNTSGTNLLSGNLQVNGNVTLGNATSDSVTFNGMLASDIVPSVDTAFDLGSATNRFRNIYAGTTTISNLIAGGSASSTFIINSDNASADTEDASLEFSRGSLSPNAIIKWDSTNDRFDFNNFAVRLQNKLIVSGTASSSFAGPLWVTGLPQGTGLRDASLYINPGSAPADNSLFSVGVNDVERFRIDAEGDTTIRASLGIQNTLYNISADTLTVDDKLQINGNEIKDSSGTTRLALGATNAFTGGISATGALNIGANTITSGLINGQTISSAANFTGSLTATGGTTTLAVLLVGGANQETDGLKASIDGPADIVHLAVGSISDATGVSNTTKTSVLTLRGTAVKNAQLQLRPTLGNGTLVFSGSTAQSDRISDSSTLDVSIAPDGGNVSIGVLGTTATLEVAKNNFPEIRISDLQSGGRSYGFTSGFSTKGFFEIIDKTLSATRLAIDTNGNVGIGTTTPLARFEVNGAAGATDALFKVSSVSGGFATTTRFLVDSSGNTTFFGASTTLQNLTFVNATGTSATTTNFFSTTASSTNLFSSLLTVGGNGLVVTSSRNVGVGVTNPDQRLQINNPTAAGDSYLHITNADSGQTGANGLLIGGLFSGGVDTQIWNYENGFLRFATNNTEQMRITSGGNVGIGGTNVSTVKINNTDTFTFTSGEGKLQVTNSSSATSTDTLVLRRTGAPSTTHSTGILFTDANSMQAAIRAKRLNATTSYRSDLQFYTGDGVSDFQDETNVRMTIRYDGSVGIGTTNPSHKLDIVANTGVAVASLATTTDLGLRVTSSSVNTTEQVQNGIRLGEGYSGLYSVDRGTSGAQGLGFFTGTIASISEAMRIQESGFVGIGTTNPSSLLHLASTGDIDLIIDADTDNSNEEDNPRLILRQDGNLVNSIFGTTGNNAQYSGMLGNATFIENKDVSAAASIQFVTGGSTIGGTDGVARMTIRNNGLVGIGTNAPQEMLHISTTTSGAPVGVEIESGSNANAYLRIGEAGTSGFEFLYEGTANRLDIGGGTSGTFSPYITIGRDNGSVGIGTTQPGSANRLTVVGPSSTTSPQININPSATISESSALLFGNRAKIGYDGLRQAVFIDDNASTKPIVFDTAGSERMRIDTSGRVGIGVTNPAEILQVNGNIRLASTNQLKWDTGGVRISGNSGTQKLSMFTSNTEYLVLDSAGSVGIGITAPLQTLHVASSSAAVPTTVSQTNISAFAGGGIRIQAGGALSGSQDAITYQSSSSGGAAAISFGRGSSWDTFMAFYTNSSSNTGAGNILERMRLDSNGSLGIGLTNPSEKLHVSGNALITGNLTVTNATSTSLFSTTLSGTRVLAGNGSASAPAYSFSADSSMGLYRVAANRLGVVPGASLLAMEFEIINAGLDQRRIKLYGAGNTDATPHITHNDDTTTGIRFVSGSPILANSKLVFDVNSSAAMVVGDGKVGIGTSTPDSALAVYGTDRIFTLNNTTNTGNGVLQNVGMELRARASTSLEYIDFAGNSTSSTTPDYDFRLISDSIAAKFSIYASTTGTALTVDKIGNIGIGTTNPGVLLQVGGDSAGSLSVKGTSSSNPLLTLDNSPRTSGRKYEFNFSSGGVSELTLRDVTDSLDVMTWSSGGNVGIGQTSPTAKLQIAGGSLMSAGTTDLGIATALTSGRTGSYDSGSLASINTRGDATSIELIAGSSASFYTGFTATGNNASTLTGTARIFTAGTERVRVTNAGNIGIGTTNPSAAKLEVLDTSGTVAVFRGSTSQGLFIKNGKNLAGGTEATLSSITSSGSLGGPLAFGTGNDEWMRITIGGNVGIGTTTPDRKLNIFGTGDTRMRISSDGTGPAILEVAAGTDRNASTTNYIFTDAAAGDMYIRTDSASQNLILQAGGTQGNVAIGTTAPSGGRKLTVAADLSTDGTGQIVMHGASNTAQQLFMGYNTTDDRAFIQAVKQSVSFVPLVLNPAGGNVGIGTTTPDTALNVVGGQVYDAGTSGSLKAQLRIGKSGQDGGIAFARTSDGLYTGSIGTSGSNLQITNSQGAGHINLIPSGNVGIGITNPDTKLYVSGGIRATGTLRLDNGSGSGQGILSLGNADTLIQSDSSIFSRWRTWNGSASYNTAFTFDGQLNQFAIPSVANCNPIKADSSGVLNCSSDERLKDISGNYTSGLSVISAINPILYTWKANSGLHSSATILGFSAQNVESVLPQAVTYDSAGYRQLNEFGILAASVNAIKELDMRTSSTTIAFDALIVALNNRSLRIDALEHRVEDVEARLATLESMMASSTSFYASSTSALSFEATSTNPFVATVLTVLGSTIVDGVTHFKDVVVSALTVGSSENPTGITLFDSANGAPYCVRVVNGASVTLPGKCSNVIDLTQAALAPVTPSSQGPIVSEIVLPGATDTTASSTPSTTSASDTASSTAPTLPSTPVSEPAPATDTASSTPTVASAE